MSKKSETDKVVRASADSLPRRTKADRDRLRRAMKGSIDTRDIPEAASLEPLKRDPQGVSPQRKSMIREAIESRRAQLGITPYRLWKMALPFHASLSQAAVHEFLKGRRQLELVTVHPLLSNLLQRKRAVNLSGSVSALCQIRETVCCLASASPPQ